MTSNHQALVKNEIIWLAAKTKMEKKRTKSHGGGGSCGNDSSIGRASVRQRQSIDCDMKNQNRICSATKEIIWLKPQIKKKMLKFISRCVHFSIYDAVLSAQINKLISAFGRWFSKLIVIFWYISYFGFSFFFLNRKRNRHNDSCFWAASAC